MPARRRQASTNAHVLPFPFVPATWMYDIALTLSVIPRRSRYR